MSKVITRLNPRYDLVRFFFGCGPYLNFWRNQRDYSYYFIIRTDARFWKVFKYMKKMNLNYKKMGLRLEKKGKTWIAYLYSENPWLKEYFDMDFYKWLRIRNKMDFTRIFEELNTIWSTDEFLFHSEQIADIMEKVEELF